jgi:TRAP-type mannitol/chloroaromatic compound transport system permease small subunit
MRLWLRIAGKIDSINEWIGRLVAWLTLAMILIGAYNAAVRYLSRYVGISLSSNAYIELQWYMFSLVFLLGAAYTLRRNKHVRVDVICGQLSRRARGWINLLGTVLLLIPFVIVTLWVSWPSVRNSWAVREVSPDPGGLPRYPIKTVILVALGLLLLQGIAELIKQIANLRRPEPKEDEEQPAGMEGL